MPSRKRLCPRQARLHRHCLDSLEIPFSHPCVLPPPRVCQVPPPVCQVPPHICQVSPPACQTQSRSGQVTPSACQIRPLDCPDTNIFCQVPPTACQVEPPSCQVEYPICQIRPPACAAYKSRLCQGTTRPYQIRHPVSQIKPPTYQVHPPSCAFQPIGCQVDDPACQLQSPVSQFLPTNCQNQTPFAMKHPICPWDQDFCTAGTCRDSNKCRNGNQSPTPFCQNFTDEDDIIMYSDCLGPCTQSESGCENVEENDYDNQNSSHRSSNNQQDKCRDDDEFNQIPITYSNTPSRTNQNANKTPNCRNDEENMAKTRNIPHKECVNPCQNQCSSDAAGSVNEQTMNDNLNNNSTRTNFRSIGTEVCSDLNDINYSQIPQSSQDIDNIPVSKGNLSQISDNADSSSLRQTIPCCRPGYFQEQALQPNSLDNENYFQTRQEFNKEPCSSKADNKICQSCCDTSDEISTYPTKAYTDNINTDENFKQSSDYDAGEVKGPSIEASSCPRSALKNLSNMRTRSGAKVHMQEHSNGTCMDCSTCCNISDSNKVNNPHEYNSLDYGVDSEFHSEHSKSQTRFTNQSGQSEFENSVPIKGRKQFANCCKRGISTVLEPSELPANVSKAECGKTKACVQEVGASSCASSTCVANNTDSACGCHYPPAFKQFGCAGNINGTCNCSDKTK